MIISQIKTVTPEMAREWLDKVNTNNRHLNLRRAKELAKMIQEGNWRTTHQGIAFYKDGTLNKDNPCVFELYKNGGLFATKEDAQEWVDAMKGARR